jgi:CubicO group peptidase (beta-lactamase class C family)
MLSPSKVIRFLLVYAKMKKVFLLLPTITIVLAVAFRQHTANANATPPSVRPDPMASTPQSLADPDVAARITRIENGLLPAIIIKGQPPKPMTLAGRMAFYKVPGVSMAFFDHGKIIWTQARGFADVATKKPLSSDTLFQAASISKPVAALAALRLVQEGKLSLEEDVNVKLKAWKVPENAFTQTEKVTLRRILSHTAGLTVHGFAGYASGEPVPTTVQILDGEKPANSDPIRVDIVPGVAWRYSGGGYVILQALMIDATGKPFPQIMRELVLDPAGMTHSTYEQPLSKSRAAEAATPYRANGEPVKGGAHTYPEMAPAGLWTTPTDLAKMAIEVQEEYMGESSKILNQSTAKQMLAHQTGTWGLGFGLENPGSKLRFGHSGANEGFRCNLQAYTDSGQGFVVMTNSDNGGELAEEIFRSVAKEYGWPDYHPTEHGLIKANPASFQPYVGTYEIPGTGKLTVTLKTYSLYIQSEGLGPDPLELLPESANQFFNLANDFTFTFDRLTTDGPVFRLTVHAGPQTFEAKKIS